MRISVLSALFLGALAVGCSAAKSSGASPDGGTANPGPGTATTAEAPLTCIGILECASKCGDNNDPCENACVAKGTPDGKAGTDAIVACFTKFNCEDETCFQDNCSNELVACVKPAPGQPLTGEAPAGSIAADLVGQWYGNGELWNFKADGSFIHGGSVNTSGCGTGTNESGTAVASGTTLTAHVTAGATSVCGRTPTDPFVPNTKEFTYAISTIHLDQGDQRLLTLTNLACVTKNGSDTWCIDKFTRQ